MTVKVQFVKNYVVFHDKEYKGTDGLGKLCRDLVFLGYGDEDLECYRGEMPCLKIPEISLRAEKSLRENDRGLQYRQHQAFSQIRNHPLNFMSASSDHLQIANVA